MKYYEKLIEQRKKLGITQEELATNLEVSRQTIYKWESGKSTPTFTHLLSICKYLNISINNLQENEISEKKELTLGMTKIFRIIDYPCIYLNSVKFTLI